MYVRGYGEDVPIPVLIDRLKSALESYIQIRTSAEYLARASDDYALDAVVYVEHAERLLELKHHGVGESIVVLGAPEREDDDAGILLVVLCFYLRPFGVVVGLGEGDGGTRGRHCVEMIWGRV